MKKYYLLGSLLIIFFFSKGGERLFNNFDSHFAYMFDQLALAFVGGTLALIWLRKKAYFRLGFLVVAIIIAAFTISHVNSFSRVFWYDELRNIINPLSVLHGFKGDPAPMHPFAMPWGLREKYGWSFATLIYELVDISHPYSLIVWSLSSLFLLVVATLSTAWLAGVISKSQLTALLAGLLIGIPPNSFISLRWITNMQTDGIGVLLVTLTVGVWFIARKTKDVKGIFIALILLAATLKGGSVVRTAITGGLLILTDLVFFREIIKRQAWKDWIKVFLVSIAYYFSNPGVQWTDSNLRTPDMSFITRLSFLADGTTRSFISTFTLTSIINSLKPISTTTPWTVILGAIIFVVGTTVAIFTYFKPKYSYFTWGWVWFYICIWYIGWLGELPKQPNDGTADLNAAGYEFAYLSMVGLYIVTAIFLGKQILKKRLVGVVFSILTIGLLVYRTYDFVKLDYIYKNDFSDQRGSWFNLVFISFPPPQGIHTEPIKNPRFLVELDKEYIRQEAVLYMPEIYHDGSLLFYPSASSFYQNAFLKKEIPLGQVYAIKWDPYARKFNDFSLAFRNYLSQFQNSKKTPDFTVLEKQ